ncbi:transporter substrate-binding domain-containing protein [Pseudoalteromonas sp. SMS1]|uniref:substrate-binding periplasmic protein n=1 Tax=Pseudoalteromonas sp. SMS1 TaxID=2908894 RepID=UPI001F2B09FA|nr:transporter substrate-binding domain-containing protein [Pseudoalteromonas sp. SMS1]MCF2859243.1 transporter substrate-binding domain-containing protein [Pseudoalteromonas sp. SMS1]
MQSSATPATPPCSLHAKVGVVAGWPPLTSVNEAGIAQGLDIDIARLVFEHANMCIEFVRLPSAARSFAQLTKGVVDVVLMVSYTFKRKQWGYFSIPYRKERMRLFSLNQQSQPVLSLMSLLSGGATVGLSIGSYYGEEVKILARNDRFTGQFIGISTIQRRIELLNKQRVNFIIEDEIIGNYLSLRLSERPIYRWAYPIHDNDVHFLLRKEKFDELHRQRINHAITALKPHITSMVERYRQLKQPN